VRSWVFAVAALLGASSAGQVPGDAQGLAPRHSPRSCGNLRHPWWLLVWLQHGRVALHAWALHTTRVGRATSGVQCVFALPLTIGYSESDHRRRAGLVGGLVTGYPVPDHRHRRLRLSRAGGHRTGGAAGLLAVLVVGSLGVTARRAVRARPRRCSARRTASCTALTAL